MRKKFVFVAVFLPLTVLAQGFQPPALKGETLPVISQQTEAIKPFSVLGPRGAILGQQDGRFEAWIFPWKIFSNLRMSVRMQDYDVPIDVNEHAAEIDVQPDKTTLTYSHANFTIRQIMFAPKDGPADVGALVLIEIESVRPLDLTLSFDPVMQRMWPAMSEDKPSPEWVKDKQGGGFYLLHQNFPDHAAAIALRGAGSGIVPPYQERAAAWPLQFVLHFDPAKDHGKKFPLVMSLARTPQSASKEGMQARVAELEANADQLYADDRTYYQQFVKSHTQLSSPDESLNSAFAWAEVAIDQLRVKTTPDLKEEALTAGFVGSGDAARPGFGWFFGRDALWSLYAVNSYGDYETTRQEIEFLLHRQRADGKMMHEWSQTANLVNWASLPYQYASADATLLLPMAVNDYLKISGDRDFIAKIWPNLESAWKFETSHDSDGDGIYENTEGTGWVESWIPSMPHQEIYLAALDQQASTAFADLAQATGHTQLATEARARAQHIAAQIEKEYYMPAAQDYAFSRNADGSVDKTSTIMPTVAWWDGDYSLKNSEPMVSRWGTAEFSTDWGTRILSDRVSFYDPISYHQGTVWPLFTGWASVAEYRTGHDLSGYAHLMQNAELTWSQDLGDVTELLSGRFFQVLGRSTAHQLWSSAMVISPVLRGMFGLEWNVQDHTMTVSPSLPAAWPEVTLRQVPFGDKTVDLHCRREGAMMRVDATGSAVDGQFKLMSHVPGARTQGHALLLPLPAVEAGIVEQLPEFGAETHALKVLAETRADRQLTLRLAAPAGSLQELYLRENTPQLHLAADHAQISPAAAGIRNVQVAFPQADKNSAENEGYTETDVVFRW